MGKRILFISCGKRNGNTWQAAQVVARSAGNSGAESMLIEAGRLEGIGRGCIGCMKCQKSAEFGCVLGDEVAELIMEKTQIPCVVADDPASCAAYGCGKSLAWINHMQEGPINIARKRMMRAAQP